MREMRVGHRAYSFVITDFNGCHRTLRIKNPVSEWGGIFYLRRRRERRRKITDEMAEIGGNGDAIVKFYKKCILFLSKIVDI